MGQKVRMSVNSTLCHGTHQEIPVLRKVILQLLPRSIISILQLMGGGIITAAKMLYRSRVTERAVEVIDCL